MVEKSTQNSLKLKESWDKGIIKYYYLVVPSETKWSKKNVVTSNKKTIKYKRNESNEMIE